MYRIWGAHRKKSNTSALSAHSHIISYNQHCGE